MTRKLREKLLRCFLSLVLASSFVNSQKINEKYLQNQINENFSLLIDFTCAAAKDELEKHPEMRVIALIELVNSFPSCFSSKILKCLPSNVTKVILMPHSRINGNRSIILPKQSMIIYVADKVRWTESFFNQEYITNRIFPVVHHLSKFLIVSSDKTKLEESEEFFMNLLNVVQLYEEDQKIIAKTFDMVEIFTTLAFNTSNDGNLSEILYPEKGKNLNGLDLYAIFENDADASKEDSIYSFFDDPDSKWTPFINLIGEKLNATILFEEMNLNESGWKERDNNTVNWMKAFVKEGQLDFYLNYITIKTELESYTTDDFCFLAPLPPKFSIVELVLFMPIDASLWFTLGMTVAFSTIIWKISEDHWVFCFGAFACFVGQSVRIRTTRLILKILLQTFILSLFVISTCYQSLVTSFMLDPVTQKLLKTVDEVLDSDLNIEMSKIFHDFHLDNSKYQKALKDGRVKETDSIKEWYKEAFEMHLASAQSCSLLKSAIDNWGDGIGWNGMYLIPEPFYSGPRDLYVAPFHPYLDEFQQLMDRSFEAGLLTYWDKQNIELHNKKALRQHPDEKTFLDFKSIAPFFLILVFGFLMAFLAIFCEIFQRDFVAQLSKEYFERKFGEFLGRKRRKVKVRKLKVERIQVKPLNMQSSAEMNILKL